MKSRSTLACAAIVLALVSPQGIEAKDRAYVQLDVRQLSQVEDFDNEQSFGATFGYLYSDAGSFEFEFQPNGFDLSSPGYAVDADAFTYLLNYRHVFHRSGPWSIHGRVGAGVSDTEFGTSPTTRRTDSLLVWHAGLGAEYAWNNGFYLSGDLRAQHFGKAEADGVSFDIGTPIAVGVSLGLRF